MKCPKCGHENRVGEMICAECGSDLYELMVEEATKNLSPKRTRDLRHKIPSSMDVRPLILYVGNITMPVAIERLPDQVIGRSDKTGGVVVDVDLTDYEGQEWGVSRRHARMDARADPPVLYDLGSYNGTFVNGVRLQPERPCALSNGDEIRFGRLATWIYFK